MEEKETKEVIETINKASKKKRKRKRKKKKATTSAVGITSVVNPKNIAKTIIVNEITDNIIDNIKDKKDDQEEEKIINEIYQDKKPVHLKRILIIILILILIISGCEILLWFYNNNSTSKITEEIQSKVNIVEVEDTASTEIIKQTTEESNAYFDYIKMNLLDVDLTALKQENSDTIGWLMLNGTNINYPVVQTKDNSYYLSRSFNKKRNNAGWVFADYRNNISKLDENTIIYAHARLDTSMFGTLRNILSSSWTADTNNYVLNFITDDYTSLWQVFSIYKIDYTNDYLKISFDDKDIYQEWLDKLKNRSQFDFKTSISNTDKIITLSTCDNNGGRVVLHAKLIKIQYK